MIEQAVPQGFKRTEMGVIPEDWDSKPLGQVSDLLTGYPFPSNQYSDSGVRLVRGSNVKRGSLDWSDNITEYWPAVTKDIWRYRLHDGDLVVAMDGALVGRSYAVISRSDLPCLLLQRVARIRSRSIHATLLANMVGSNSFVEHVDSVKTHTAIPHISPGDIRSFVVAVPPNPAEQRAIAAALVDINALVAALNKLIAKKRSIKTAAMQQLLTGKRRLPGFSREWQTKRLGDVLTIRHGKSQHNVVADDGPYPILATGGEIGRSNAFLYDKPSVLIGRKGTIDRPQYQDSPFWTVDTLFYSEVGNKAYPKFMYYKFLTIDWRSHNEASGVPSLNAATIENVEIQCPNVEEQTAIAAVLADMEAEIEALEARREKTQQVKQGMMQELLTGKTRLI